MLPTTYAKKALDCRVMHSYVCRLQGNHLSANQHNMCCLCPAVLLQHWELRRNFLQELQSAAAAAGKGVPQASSCSSYLHGTLLAVQQHGSACLQSHM
jgi:hypothetical protein